jgi:predicted anti-sigma-YlaC factor YlaD
MPASTDEVTRHLAGCAECRQFEAKALAANRQMRIAEAPTLVDRTDQLVAAMTRSRSDWRLPLLRALLVGVAAFEIAAGASALFGGGAGELPVHVARELGGFSLALGVGFLLAALRPLQISGLLPVVMTLAITSLAGAAVDVIGGRADLAGEAHHLLEVLAVVALWRLTLPRRRVSARPVTANP